MEEQLDTMNAILQDMQQTLKCNICLDMLNNPLTTKCGHSFCGECIQQLIRRPRGAAQCPLCMGPITRRSVSRNSKMTALVLAVRRVIASIKKDCCFEVTPSKYRPRPRPEAAVEDDDSENEEKDEPRRGTRKRGATALYNPEVVTPRPRPRPAKRRILAANGAQELSLHSDGATMHPEEAGTGRGGTHLVEAIARDHTYSSPTKQAPLERPSTAPASAPKPRSKGRGGAGQAVTTYLGPKKADEKNGDALVSASQGEQLVFPGEAVGGTGQPIPCLGRERPEDKVAKWLDRSREVGFRIGAPHSSTPTATPSPTPPGTLHSSGYPRASLSTSTGPQDSTPASSTTATTASTTKRFFKSKESAPVLAPALPQGPAPILTQATVGDSQDTYTFIPSQKTPPRRPQAKRRGRGRGQTPGRGGGASLGVGRARGRGQGGGVGLGRVRGQCRGGGMGLGRVRGQGQGGGMGLGRVRGRSRGTARPLDSTGLPEVVMMLSSTPMGRPGPQLPLEVSVITAPPQESLIVRDHDDKELEDTQQDPEEEEEEEGRGDLPDSCPVTTLDQFDQLVAKVKEAVPPRHAPPPSRKEEEEEDGETGLLFVTPAQEGVGEQATLDMVGQEEEEGEEDQEEEEQDDDEAEVGEQGSHQPQPHQPPVNNSSSSDGGGGGGSRGRRSLKQQQEAVECLLEGVAEHQLATATAQQEEQQRRQQQQQREAALRQDLSLLALTHDNTLHNASLNTAPTPPPPQAAPTTAATMAPPPVPAGRRRVRFDPNSSQSDGPGTRPPKRANTRYASELKHHLVEPGRPTPAPVSLKSARSAKSPGWSHVEGARKDLTLRSTALNITGGEGRPGSEGSRGGGVGVPLSSSVETSLSIEDTQQPQLQQQQQEECDVEHLPLSQTKSDRLQRLRDIVTSITTHHQQPRRSPSPTEEGSNTVIRGGGLPDTSPNNTSMENVHTNNNNNKNTEDLHAKDTAIRQDTHLDTSNTSIHSNKSPAETPTDSVPTKGIKKLRLSLHRLIPQVEKMAQEKPYIVKDAEKESESLSPRVRQQHQGKPVREREDESEGLGAPVRSQPQGNQDPERERERVAPCMEKNGVTGRDEEETHSIKANAVVSLYEDTGPFLVDGMHSNDTPGHGMQVEPARASPQQQQPVSQRRKERGTSPQQGRKSDQAPQQNEQIKSIPQQGKQKDLTPTTTSKRKVRDPSPQQEKQDNTPTQQTTQPGKRSKQAATADTPESSQDTAKGTRKTFSFTTDTEDLDALIHQDNTATDTQHSTAQEKQPRKSPRGKALSLSRFSDTSTLSNSRLPHHSMSPTATTPTEPMGDYAVTPKQDMTPGELREQDNVTSDVTNEIMTPGKGDLTSMSLKAPSMTLGPPQEEGQVMEGHAVVPFKAVGPLCTKGCQEASVLGGAVPRDVAKDLCLHAVPCEVYQVILKYMHLLATQPNQHRECCGVGLQQQPPPPPSQPTTTSQPQLESSQPTAGRGVTKTTQPETASEPQPSQLSQPTQPWSSQLSQSTQPWSSQPDVATEPQTSQPAKRRLITATQPPSPPQPATGQHEDEEDKEDDDEMSSSQKSVTLFDLEMIHSSCPTQDLATVLPLPLPPSASGQGDGSTSPEPGVLGASQQQEPESEDILLQPQAARDRLRRPAATTTAANSQASQEESVSLLANLETEEGVAGVKEAQQQQQAEGRGPDKTERRAAGGQRGRDKAAAAAAAQRVAGTAEVEKENVQSLAGQPPTPAPALRRKPQKGGRPVLEDILTQRGGCEELPSTHKALPPPTAKPLFSSDPGRGRGQRGEAGTGAGEGNSHPARTRLSTRRRFLRINRPPSSSSESEGEAAPAPTQAPALTQAKAHPASPASPAFPAFPTLSQHLLDSEEMRDLERLDRNVWEEFGHPDDLLDDTLPDPNHAGHPTPTSAHSTHSALSTAPTLTASTKRVVERADRLLAGMEDFLGPDTSPAPPCSPTSPGVVQETDDEKEDEEEKEEVRSKRRRKSEEEDEEEETQSHGSTQSEGISTQKQKEMKDEIEALRKKKEEVMAALGNRKKEEEEEEEEGSEMITPSQDNTLAPTCPFVAPEMEEDNDLFPSNPGDGGGDAPSTPAPPPPPSLSPPPPPSPSQQEVLSVLVKRTPRAQLASSLSTGRGLGRGGARTNTKNGPCIIFSGLGLAERRRIQDNLDVMEGLGLRVRAAWGPEVTHVVVQAKKKLAPRTLKYLYGVAAGCWVLSQAWVMDSIARGKLMPEEPYEVLDETGEDGPRRSRASTTHLLGECYLCLIPPFEDMTPEQVKELAETSGAQVVSSPSALNRCRRDKNTTLTLIVLDSEREAEGKELMGRHGVVAVGHNWLVDSITAHRLAPFPEHLLGTPAPATVQASGIPPALMMDSQAL